MNMVACTSHQY